MATALASNDDIDTYGMMMFRIESIEFITIGPHRYPIECFKVVRPGEEDHQAGMIPSSK